MPLYETSTLGVGDNQVTFNDDAGTPYFRLLSRTYTKRELDEFDIKLPEQTGDSDFQTLIGKTYLILAGTMYPDDERGFDVGHRMLRKLASLEIEQADTSADEGYVPYAWQENDGYNKQIFVKVLYVDMPESTQQGLKQPFRLVCKIKYPVVFGQIAETATIGLPSAFVTTGIGFPMGFPAGFGANTYQSNGAITNHGDLATFPSSITITGPINVPRFTNTSTGEYIEVNVNLGSSSDTLSISYDQDSQSIIVDGNSILNALTSGSTLFKLKPGNNNFTLTGSTMGSGAYAQINALPAWPLS